MLRGHAQAESVRRILGFMPFKPCPACGTSYDRAFYTEVDGGHRCPTCGAIDQAAAVSSHGAESSAGLAWILAVVLLTALMGLWVIQIYNDPRSGGEYIGVLAPIILWMLGMALLVGLGAVGIAGRLLTRRSGPRLVCTSCGAELFGQWWNDANHGYDCRNCGATTAGRPADGTPEG